LFTFFVFICKNLCFYLLFTTKGNLFISISRHKGKKKILKLLLFIAFYTSNIQKKEANPKISLF